MALSSHHPRNARSIAFASKSCQRSIAFLRAGKALKFAYAFVGSDHFLLYASISSFVQDLMRRI